MKPHKPTKSETGLARIRLILRTRLEWLHGFPLPDGAWCTIPPERGAGEILEVDRKLVSRTTRAVNELIRDYPRALPKVVGDKKTWEHRLRTMLELVSPLSRNKAIETGNLFADSNSIYPAKVTKKALLLEQQNPVLEPVLDAFSWLLYLQPEMAGKALRWIELHQAPLTILLQNNKKVPAVRFVLQLWRISMDGNAQADMCRQLLELAGCKLVYRKAFFQIEDILKAITVEKLRIANLKQIQAHPFCFSEMLRRRWRNDSFDFKPDNPYSVFKRIRGFTEFLANSGIRTRKRATRLIRFLNLGELVHTWRQWWQELEDTLFIPSRPVDQEIFESARKHLLLQHLEGIIKKLKTTRPLFPDKHFFHVATWLASPDQKTLLQSLLKVPPLPELNGIPGEHLQQRVLYNVASFFNKKRHTLNLARTTHYIRRYYRFLDSKEPEITARRVSQFEPSIFDPKSFASPTSFSGHNVYAKLENNRHIDTFFGAIEILSAHKQYSSQWFRLVRRFSRLIESPGAVANLAWHVLEGNLHYSLEDYWLRVYSDDAIRVALHLADQNDPEFPEVCDVANELLELFFYRVDDTTVSFLETCKRNRVDTFLVKYIQTFYLRRRTKHHAEQQLLQKLFTLFGINRQLRKIPVTESGKNTNRPADWITNYPDVFHSLLKEYLEVLPNTKSIAANVLGKDFPDHIGMQKELHSLQTKLKNNPDLNDEGRGRLTKRVRNLEQYLDNPVMPSPERLDRLMQQLQQRLLTAIFDNWHLLLKQGLQAAQADKLEACQHPDIVRAFEDYPELYKLFHLEDSLQSLILRLLSARSGDPPWDLREAKQNAGFIQKMGDRNIDMTPWLDGIPGMHVEVKDQSITIKLEADPLEIFLMGYHFQTCLSPGRENFYSTVVNAADINKRVIYARNQNDNVVGRMLIALTSSGGLLAFHAYSHLTGLHKHIEEFVHRLASAMRAVIVPSGSIEPLMHSYWYNDGPRDIANQFDCLKPDSDFRRSLKKIKPEQLIRSLKKALAPHELNELTLELIVNLDEIKARSELLVPLIPYIARYDHLSLRTLTEILIGLMVQIDKAGLVPVKFSAVVDRFRQRMLTGPDDWSTWQKLPLLARFAPRDALRLTRKFIGVTAIDQYRKKEYGLEFLFAVMIAYHRLEQPVLMNRMIEIILPIMEKYPYSYCETDHYRFIEWIRAHPPGITYPCWPF